MKKEIKKKKKIQIKRNSDIPSISKTPVYIPTTSMRRRRIENGKVIESRVKELKRYYSSIDAEIYLGDQYVEDICDISYSVEQQSLPIYGYNSYTYDEIAIGSRIVSGTFSIRFISPNYLFDVLETANSFIDFTENMNLDVIDWGRLYGEETGYKGLNDQIKNIVEENDKLGRKRDGHRKFTKFEYLWDRKKKETFDIDIIYGQDSKAGEAVHVILKDVKILGVAMGASVSSPMPLTETYHFVANDIETVI